MAVRELPPEDRQELRLAVVMNGGVSLAVWMGGVATEIDRLRRGVGAYGDVLRLTSTEPRVDVVSGASAGGLNGAFLATAIAFDRPLEGLYEMWIDKGQLDKLLRSPTDPSVPSLLKGDEFFLPALRDAFGVVAGRGQTSDDPRHCVSLTMTTSVFSGIGSGLSDDLGTVIPDAAHLGRFRFVHGGGRHDWSSSTDAEREERLARLAVAARSSASFPVAFEPSFVRVGGSDGGAAGRAPWHPDMAAHVNFSSSRFAVDGGALMNKPFRPALEDIYTQPAGREVRRALLYVCPDPGTQEPDVADTLDRRPTMAQTVIDSAVSMPRTESVAEDLRSIRDNNERVTAHRRMRDFVLTLDGRNLAPDLWAAYRRARVEASTQRILTALDAGVYDSTRDRTRTWPRAVVGDALRAARMKLLPEELPLDRTSPDDFVWGIAAVENMAIALVDLLARALRSVPFDDQPLRGRLREARAAVHDRRRQLADARVVDGDFWTDEAPAALDAAHRGRAAAEGWADGAFARWDRQVSGGPPDRSLAEIARVAHEIAGLLVGARNDLLAAAGDRDDDTAALLRSAVSRLAPPAAGPVARRVEETLRRLLALDVVLTVFDSTATVFDSPASRNQAVELFLVSGNATNAFSEQVRPDQKLAGVQMGHFGAFYKASWRANDWMFGRLDAANRLALVLVNPARLRQLSFTPEQAFEEIVKLCHGTVPGHEEPPEVRAWLADRAQGGLDARVAIAELEFLRDPATTTPTSLPECARALARRLQLGIVGDELPRVRTALDLDDRQGALRTSAREFRTAYDRCARPPKPADTVGLFRRCDIGVQTLHDDVGSDLFTATVTTTAAVAVAAGSQDQAGLGPLRVAFTALRTFMNALHFLAQSAVRGTRAAFASTTALLASGGFVVALSLTEGAEPSTALVLVGWTLVAAGLVVAWIFSATRLSALVLVLATAAGFAAPYLLIDSGSGEDWRRVVRPALAGLALVAVPMVLGPLMARSSLAWRSRRRWRERARRTTPAAGTGGGGDGAVVDVRTSGAGGPASAPPVTTGAGDEARPTARRGA